MITMGTRMALAVILRVCLVVMPTGPVYIPSACCVVIHTGHAHARSAYDVASTSIRLN